MTSEWISVKDRIPPAGELVMVYGVANGYSYGPFFLRSIRFARCYFTLMGERHWQEDGSGDHLFRVTHWTPMPEKP